MTTKTPASGDEHKQDKAWWEKLTDSTSDADSGQRILKLLIIAALVVTAAVGIWKFLDQSQEQSRNERAQILEIGLTLLPDQQWVNYGVIGDLELRQDRGRQSVASAFLRSHPGLMGRDSTASAFSEPERAATYKEDVENAIQQLQDRQSEFTDKEWEGRYLHTLQQLHFYAAINSATKAERLRHLDKQLAIVADLKARHADHGIFSLKPLPSKPDMTILDCFEEAGKAEKEFLEKHNIEVKLEADKGLKCTIELENGKTLELEFYSRVAPKAVKNFLARAKRGEYDGTAFHALDANAGTLTGGGLFSKLHPDRKFIWGSENPGYVMTSESTALLPTKRGVVTLQMTGATGHAMFFRIHTVDPDVESNSDTVFARVTSGLENLDEWMGTEVHDEPGLNNKFLPRVRLGIKKVTVTGEMANSSPDSWQPPSNTDIKAPEVTAAEKSFMEALKKLKEGSKEDQPARDEDGK